MNLDDIIDLAAKQRAQELIEQIEADELTYEQAIAGLQGE